MNDDRPSYEDPTSPDPQDAQDTQAFARPDVGHDPYARSQEPVFRDEDTTREQPSYAAWGDDDYLFGASSSGTAGAAGAAGAGAGYDPDREARAAAKRDRRKGRRRAGALVAVSLVVGALGGFGGAAAFQELAPQQSSTATGGDGVTTTVVDSGAVQAAPGSVQAVADQVLPSVVQVLVTNGDQQGSGSGIILTDDGTILTNAHVVEGAGPGGELVISFNDGTTAPATVVGEDPVTDVAVIKAEGVSGLQSATLGRSDNLRVGQNVVAIGSPFGLSATVTTGIVSALDRPVAVGQIGETDQSTIYPAIQTDAAINPGNSGGPLVNMNGEVVGINSSIRTGGAALGGTSGSIGLGFAIPLDEVAPIISQIRNGETPTHARIGITVSDALSDAGLPRGAEVQSVSPGSAGAEAGLREGDVITKLDGVLVEGSDSLVAQIRSLRPGERITLEVLRGDSTTEVQATLMSDADPA